MQGDLSIEGLIEQSNGVQPPEVNDDDSILETSFIDYNQQTNSSTPTTEAPNQILFNALLTGDVELTENLLLTAGLSVNAPLPPFVNGCCYAPLQFLCDLRASVHLPLKVRERLITALKDSVGGTDCQPVLEMLLRMGADPCITGSSGFSALHAAALCNNCPALQTLLGTQLKDNLQGYWHGSLTPLHISVLNCCPAAVRLLLDAGADVNAAAEPAQSDLAGVSAFQLAVADTGLSNEIFTLMTQAGACADTALKAAALNSSVNLCFFSVFPDLGSEVKVALRPELRTLMLRSLSVRNDEEYDAVLQLARALGPALQDLSSELVQHALGCMCPRGLLLLFSCGLRPSDSLAVFRHDQRRRTISTYSRYCLPLLLVLLRNTADRGLTLLTYLFRLALEATHLFREVPAALRAVLQAVLDSADFDLGYMERLLQILPKVTLTLPDPRQPRSLRSRCRKVIRNRLADAAAGVRSVQQAALLLPVSEACQRHLVMAELDPLMDALWDKQGYRCTMQSRGLDACAGSPLEAACCQACLRVSCRGDGECDVIAAEVPMTQMRQGYLGLRTAVLGAPPPLPAEEDSDGSDIVCCGSVQGEPPPPLSDSEDSEDDGPEDGESDVIVLGDSSDESDDETSGPVPKRMRPTSPEVELAD